ncbi:MAG: hypothetical protein KAX16_02885 [Actinomycetia bacterium]|nr:hypothetical protein [Actinomycetes bacterium]
MLNKEKARTWVKVVAWGLAISFAMSMSLLLIIPTTPRNNSVNQSPRSSEQNPLTPLSKSKVNSQVSSAIGQGDLAMKNNEMGQAISYYEKAHEIDKKNKDAVSKLSNAYYSHAQELQADGTDTAKTFYNKYLELSPEGEHSAQAKSALEELE